MALTTAQQKALIQYTVGLYGAAAGGYMAELAGYVNQGYSTQAVGQALATSASFKGQNFGFSDASTNSQFVDAFCTNLLGSNVAATPLAALKAQMNDYLDKGYLNRSQLAQIIIDKLAAVPTTDADFGTAAKAFANKVTVASYYTIDLGGTSTSLTGLQSTISGVTATTDVSSAAAIQTILNNPNSGTVGGTYVLTAGADVFEPNSATVAYKTTAYNDTFRAPTDGYLTSVDYVDAAAGYDVLTASITANSQTIAPVLKSVEDITLTVTAADTKTFKFDAATVTGATTVTIKDAGAVSMSSSDELITVSNLEKTTTLGIVGGAASTGGTASEITATFASAAAADTQKVAISTLGKVGVLTLSTAETVQITATGTGTTGANTIGSLKATAVKTLNLLGAGDLTVSASDLATTTTVDATQATGKITFAAEAGTTSFTFKGGSGITAVSGTTTGTVNITTGIAADTIDISGGDSTATVNAGDGDDRVLVGASTNITTADGISGGTGTNTIVVTDATINATTKTNLQKGTSNFQVLGTTATAAVTIDFNALSYIDSVRVEGADAGAAQGTAGSGVGAVSVAATMENPDTLTLVAARVGQQGADGGSGADGANGGAGLAVTPKLDGGANVATLVFVDNADITGGKGGALNGSATNDGSGGAAVNASTIEQLNIVLHGSDTTADTVTFTGGAAGGSGGTAAAGVGLIVEANATITITDAKIGSGTKYSNLDLGTVTGNNVIINASGLHGDLTVTAASGNVQVTGGSGNDTITGGAGIDTINGGTGNDIIDAKAGADILAGGGGRDHFIVSTNSDSSAANMDKISDFGKVTTATTAAQTAAMTNQAAFVASATAVGGADADLLKLSATATLGGAAAGVDVSAAVTGGGTVLGSETAKGIITVTGAQAANVDTLAEWIAVANIMAGAGNDVVAFEFSGNTYVFQQSGTDTVVELTGVTGVTGITLINAANAAAVGDIFML